MKVKAVRKKNLENIIIGKEYIVLMIEFYNTKDNKNAINNDFIYYRVIDEGGAMLPFSSESFEVTNNNIPESWVFVQVTLGYSMLMPKKFNYDLFLEDYYDGEKIAVSLVEKEFRILNVQKENLYEILKNIINEWDPIYLLESNSYDFNYDIEINNLVQKISEINSIAELSHLISIIFSEKYNDFIISKVKDNIECNLIAERIWNVVKKIRDKDMN